MTGQRPTPVVVVTPEFVIIDGRPRPARYLVTTTTGYRAILPACLRDECADGTVPFCPKPDGHIETVNAWLAHCETWCHGWHAESVARFAADVERTYGAKHRTPALPTRRGYVPTGKPERIAELLGWSVEDVAAELAKAAG